MRHPQTVAPLTGITVVDCSTVLAGPYCTMLLGDLGADVIKVEPPDGDATRTWGPPWVGDEASGTRTAAYYLAVNRNKRALRLDLRREEGRAVLRRLLAGADVVVENFRVGGFERLGFSDAALAALNPRLIHLAISGFGPTGPDAGKPGYDFVIQALGGLMSITGEPEGRPLKVGVAISDVVTGLFGAVSVLGALVGRERAGAAGVTGGTGGSTGGTEAAGGPGEAAPAAGHGTRIDLSLLESTLAVLVNQAQNAFVTGRPPARRGNAHPSIVPYETFATADGAIAVGVGSQRQWQRFCDAIGEPKLATEARFATNGARVEHRAELIELLGARFATDATDAWLARLDAAGIPCGPILDVLAAFETPQAKALGARVPATHAILGSVDQVASPFRLDGERAPVRIAPPLIGEHAREVLADVGYSDEEIEALAASGVI
ncbi:MAG TPA: CaiB/BaiF CoA-transferase family protein [Candidatus Limnocylindrales bacterium]|nr:CaiB/BaiF CoA-transferase family protein [Candidatus Limnocylindrales bacterium]